MMINHPILLKEFGIDPVWLSRNQAVLSEEDTSVMPDMAAPVVISSVSDVPYVAEPMVQDMPLMRQDEAVNEVLASPVVTKQLTDVAQMSWTELADTVGQCQQCHLCTERTHTVFGVGDQQAKWMFVGEGPGRNEDLQGEPFVGKAGQLLDNMIKAMGVRRGDQVYIANIIKCRPTDQNGKDRRPSEEEVNACLPYLKRQIDLVKPSVIIALGHTAAWALLGLDPSHSVGKLRGKVHHYQHTPVIVTYHPSYLLRQPQDKGLAWRDLCLAMQTYAETV